MNFKWPRDNVWTLTVAGCLILLTLYEVGGERQAYDRALDEQREKEANWTKTYIQGWNGPIGVCDQLAEEDCEKVKTGEASAFVTPSGDRLYVGPPITRMGYWQLHLANAFTSLPSVIFLGVCLYFIARKKLVPYMDAGNHPLLGLARLFGLVWVLELVVIGVLATNG